MLPPDWKTRLLRLASLASARFPAIGILFENLTARTGPLAASMIAIAMALIGVWLASSLIYSVAILAAVACAAFLIWNLVRDLEAMTHERDQASAEVRALREELTKARGEARTMTANYTAIRAEYDRLLDQITPAPVPTPANPESRLAGLFRRP